MRLLLLFLFLPALYGYSQTFTLEGKVKNASTGEGIPFATVKIASIGKGATTDLDGKYTLKLNSGTYMLSVEAFGFEPQELEVSVVGDTKADVKMVEKVNQLQEVVIEVEAPDANVTKVEMSVEKLKMEEIEKMPAFLGEVDVIRSIQLLPGVTTVGEGASGFNVRGGSIDQNLVLTDGATVYSSSHLFGFFSIFNSDAVEDLTLYKGGIPARYGGRLSSVLEINQSEGNSERVSMKGGIGLVSSRFTVGGPMKKNSTKGTWQVSARRSYADLFLKMSPDSNINSNISYFYDLNGKFTYKFNKNNKLALSGYYGKDVFKFGDDFGFNWGNATTTLRWTHTFTDSLFSNLSFYYSNFNYNLGVPSGFNEFNWVSNIQNLNLHNDYTWLYSKKSSFKFGLQFNTYFVNPAEITIGEQNEFFNPFKLDKERAYEPNLYASHEYTVSSRISMEYGLRYSSYYKLGQENVKIYEEGVPKEASTIVDTLSFGSGELIKSYHALEPRLGVKFGLDSVSSIKFSYNRMKQYVHLISNTTSTIPFDVWRPSGYYIEPATADQVALGYFRNLKNNMFETSAEVYYKRLTDIVDYKDGAELILNENLEAELLTGIGRAYGLELMVRKKKGDLTGWFSYTYAKSERKVDGDTRSERINQGNWYPSNYDKRHDLTLVGVYNINKRWSVSANFTYGQGRPITLSDGKAISYGIVYPTYTNRNQARIPDYHRLDLGATLQGKNNDLKRWKSSWVFSIYNLYGRRNAFSVYSKPDEKNPTILRDYQLSILGAMVPAVTYNFEF